MSEAQYSQSFGEEIACHASETSPVVYAVPPEVDARAGSLVPLKGPCGKEQAKSSRVQLFLAVVLRCVHGDCVWVSLASCAGNAAKLTTSRSRSRGLLEDAPAKLSPGSERHLVVSGAAR